MLTFGNYFVNRYVMRPLLILFCFLLRTVAFGQGLANLDSITSVLEHVFNNDQKPRLLLDSLEKKYGFNSPEVMQVVAVMEKQDSTNKIIVTEILDKYGWLDAKETSEKANTTLFLVIQHADLATQIKYLPILKKAAAEGKTKPHYYAYLLDRTNLKQGKFQIYGTQLSNQGGKIGLDPIADEPNVNVRRKELGLNSMEEHAKQMGMSYTLPKVDSLKNKIVLIIRLFGDQNPLSLADIYWGNNRRIAQTDEKGFLKIAIDKSFFNWALIFRKEGYQSGSYVLDGAGKDIFEINIGLRKK
jgi:hypothetical protein